MSMAKLMGYLECYPSSTWSLWSISRPNWND